MTVMDGMGPAIGAGVFVIVMSRVREPTRRILNAVIVAGASGVYLSGGFGVWELVYPVVVTPVVYRALHSYRSIGIAWLMHAAWDVAHHLWGIRFGRSCRPRRSDAVSSTCSSRCGVWPALRQSLTATASEEFG
jgi:hypothetical protein